MAKKRNKVKKLIFPLIMVAVLVAMIVALLLLKNYNEKSKEAATGTEETQAVTAFSRSGVIVTKLNFKGEEDKALAFAYENELWTYVDDANYPVNSESVDSIANTLMSIEAAMKVETEGADIESFGLGDKADVVSATFSDGRKVDFKFGIVNSYNGYQYFTYTGTDEIYLVSATLLDGFKIKLEDVYQKESSQLVVDGATENDVTSVLITTADGKQNGITDEAGRKAMFTIMSEFNLNVWEDYYADEAEMKEKYGISKDGDRASISYTLTNYKKDENGEYVPVEVQKSFTVYFGNEFVNSEDGEGSENWKTFYTIEGSSVVYSISREKVTAVFDKIDYKPDSESTENKEEATID